MRNFDNFIHSVILSFYSYLLALLFCCFSFLFFPQNLLHKFILTVCLHPYGYWCISLHFCPAFTLSFRTLMLTKLWRNTSPVALPNHQFPSFLLLHQLQIKMILLDRGVVFCHQSCAWIASMVTRYWSHVLLFCEFPCSFLSLICLILKLDAVRALPWSSRSFAGIEG